MAHPKNTGHSFRFKERKYKQWSDKINELVVEMALESDPADKFEVALLSKLRDQATNCDLAASVEYERFNDRN